MKLKKFGKVAVKPKVLVGVEKRKSTKSAAGKVAKKTKAQQKTQQQTNDTGENVPGSVIMTKSKKNIVKEKTAPKKKSAVTDYSTEKAKLKQKKNHPKTLDQEQLNGLKDIDPEFYDFLKKNDKKLLEFNLYDSDDSEEGENEHSQDDGSDEEAIHKPSEKLEVASDESDFEDEDEDSDDGDNGKETTQKITLNLLRQWQVELQKPNVNIEIVRKVVQAFSSALASISDEDTNSPTNFKVIGAAAFNGTIQLCVLHLQPALLRYLGITNRANTPLHKTKKWTKVRSCLRYYLTDLIRLVEQVSSHNILSVLLKHLHQMSGMLASFSTLCKNILKHLIVLWSTEDETVRVLAFLCILKITRNQQVSMLNNVLKAMYLSYVRNSKFVSPNTLPSINFMRRSLVEMFAMDLTCTYQHAFLYIRQLAIHLRNAVILKKKDSFQAVYNWQYVNSLRLWTDLLATTADRPQLQPLMYPLVTIITGVIRLIPTAQYFPLRFHCCQLLISLSKDTNTFIPVLPFLLEVLRSNTFKTKHTAVSMRPLQFTCILRLNKTQLSENGFRDEVVEQVVALSLEYLAHESSSLAFSDLVVPAVLALKSYLKECRNANHSRKLKQLLDKIQDNARVINEERKTITFGLKDLAQVRAWEENIRNKGTPIAIYYNNWVKTHETKKRRQAAQIDAINADYDVPTIKKKAKKTDNQVVNENGEVELFPSDSEEDPMDDILQEETNSKKTEKPSKAKKDKKQKVVKEKPEKPSNPSDVDVPFEDYSDQVDIVKDLDLDDW